MRWVRRWWRQRDRFAWLTGYIAEHRLLPLAKITNAAVTGAFAAITALMLLSPSGPSTGWARATAGGAAVASAVLAALWLGRWPSAERSRLYVLVSNTCIAVACLAQSNPLAGLAGSFAFVILAAHVALLHSAKVTAYNFTVGVGVASILVYRVHASGGDVVFAASQFVVLALFGVAVPVGLNSMLNLMAADIARSDRDALTGLLNRRGFHRRTRHLIDSQADRGGGELTIAMLDLDRFKQLNDRRGHAAGDEALIDVARVLREVTHPTAVVARVGGEEFLVAEAPSPGEAPLSARLC